MLDAEVNAVELHGDGHEGAAEISAGEPEAQRNVEALADSGAAREVVDLHDGVLEAASGGAVELLVDEEVLSRELVDEGATDLELNLLDEPLARGVLVVGEVLVRNVDVGGVGAGGLERDALTVGKINRAGKTSGLNSEGVGSIRESSTDSRTELVLGTVVGRGGHGE